MPRLFKPVANSVLKGALWSVALGPLVVVLATTAYSHSQYNNQTGQPLDQVVPFSHLHHALELGIDCRYCHTSVENSAFAGIPATKVCMTCHSIVWTNSPLLQPVRDSWKDNKPLVWNRVNDLPEFVYFNHSIHIARGISCNVCHGAVQTMPLTQKARTFTMLWCLNCHRDAHKYLAHYNPDPAVSPSEQVFQLYWRIQAGSKLTPMEQKLADGDDRPENPDPHEGVLMAKRLGVRSKELADCTVCHR